MVVGYRCVRCGAATDWDGDLGSEPLCAVCWDKEVDLVTPAEIEALRRCAYRLAHEAEIKAYGRAYRLVHKAEIKAYREVHRAELNQYMRAYYRANLVRIKEYQVGHQRKYYLEHKEQVKQRMRDYRRALRR